MKKKNLIILLLLPFIIATLCIVTVNVTYDAIDVDISFIEWEYKDYEPFQIKGESTYKLKAKGVNRNNYKLADGNELVWTAVNKDGSPEPYAEIVKSGNDFYLKPLKEGEVVVTCATQKGNVSRRMTAIIYKDSVILLEQIRTLDKRRLKERIGELSPNTMKRVNTALLISLGFGENYNYIN